MEKLIFWMVLIVGTVALLGSCAEKDESTTAAAAGNVAGTGTTASGTIEGNSDLTGTFYIWWLQKPSGGCVDNTTAIQFFSFPAETLGFKKQIIITSSSTYTESVVTYSDATCSTMTSYFNTMLKTVTIGSELTGLTATTGTPARPSTANKISYLRDKYALMANTTDMVAWFLSTYGVQLDSGTEFAHEESSTSTNYNLIATETVAGSKLLFYDTARQTDNFTDWSNSTFAYWK